MKRLILCLIAVLLLSVFAFAEEGKVYSDGDLRKYKYQPITDKKTTEDGEAVVKQQEPQEATLICKKVRASINVGSHPNPYAGNLNKITSYYFSREAPTEFPVKVSATVTNVGEAGEISLTLGGGRVTVHIYEVHIESGKTQTLIGKTNLQKAEFDNIPDWECLSATRYNKETRLTTDLKIINE